MVQTANTIWRDYNTDGVPSSGEYDPKKADIRAWGTWVESIITAFTSGGGLVFTSKAALDAKLTPDADTLAWVIDDDVVDNNGIYQKQGASGIGSWTRVSDLPFSFIIASDAGAGTPNAIQATTSIPISESALIILNVFEANTASPVTVSFNGGSALTIKTNTGNDVSDGGLVSGMRLLGVISGPTFRLVSDQVSSAIVAAAEAAADRAEAAAASVDEPTIANGYLKPEDTAFSAVGDGVADDTAAITAVVGAALASGQQIYARGEYLVTGNIVNFHGVEWIGPGSIKRGTDTWFITPTGDQRNTIHVGGVNLTANDGLSSAEPTNISQAINRMRNIGSKALDGRWRIHISGGISSNGVTLENMPQFRNRLEIWGDEVAMNDEPTTVWDGAAASAHYAIRGDWAYNLANCFLHFRNIKFTNWNKSSNAGGIVVWATGDVLSENIWAANCSIGAWYRFCRAKHVYGNIQDAATFGVGMQYGAMGQVGGLAGDGVTFTNCGEGVSVGREANCYIQGSIFVNAFNCISVSRCSRIRTQGNTYTSWINAVVWAQALGTWTPDNGGGSPDTYVMTPSDTAPVFRCESGSAHPLIHRLSGNVNSWNPGGSLATVTGVTAQTLLATASGAAVGDFVPARVPCWWAYSPSAALRLELLVVLAANAGGTLALYGQGSSGALMLAQIAIPTNASARTGKVTLEFRRRAGGSAARYEAKFENSVATVYEYGASSNLNNAAIRSATDDVLTYRLYWTPTNTNQAQFVDMRSFIEV